MKGDRLACMFYLSPAGTTRRVSRKTAALLEERGWRTSELDLGKADGTGVARFVGDDLSRAGLLVVGSPSYADHVLRPVESFLQSLPKAPGTPALAFSTFGGVSKGVTLVQMTGALERKGYRVKGAAKILCVHSLFFRSGRPMSAGHPDEGDWRVVEEWLDAVCERLRAEDPYRLDPGSVRPSSPLMRIIHPMVRLLKSTVSRWEEQRAKYYL